MDTDSTIKVIGPQPGPQEDFMASLADIVIYGGAAGGGKTFALLLEPMRHIDNGLFHAAIFRRTLKQAEMPGGPIAESQNLYPQVGADYNGQRYAWCFPSGMKVSFHYLDTEKDKLNYQGAQIPLIQFDELTHFTESQFFYMLSRCRSSSGVPGYSRATCNPDPDSWVTKFIDWWIAEDGFPDASRSGVLRWFIRDGDDLIWGDTRQELIDKHGPERMPKSVTFIPASLSDNKILESKDPGYRANLLALPTVEREQLLGGNWKIKPAAGLYFKGSQFRYCDSHEIPELERRVRYWDRAATEVSAQNSDPDWTVGVLMGKAKGVNEWYIIDVERFREGPAGVLRRIKATSERDGKSVKIYLEQDPGQAGKVEVQYLIGQLAGFVVTAIPASGSKLARATPFSSQVQGGTIVIVRAHWNDQYVRELERFDGSSKCGHDDQVDGSSGAFNQLSGKPRGKFMFG